MKIFFILTLTLISQLFLFQAIGQNVEPIKIKGISINPTENINIGFHVGTQVWIRYSEMNPGTKDDVGNEVSNLFDVALRRTRFSFLANMYDEKLVLYTQFGMNGQTITSSSKPQMYIHDIWSQYEIIKKGLYIGAGLHGWSGVSRLGSISYSKNIMLDHPGFGLPNLGKTDQSGRQIGIFARGNIQKINYRFSIDKPFVQDGLSGIALNKAVYYPNTKTAYKGYAFYSFLDTEWSKSSYLGLSYLGSKKICNVGAGFDFHPQSMAYLNAADDTVLHNKTLFGADLFIDYPLSNKGVFTTYIAAYLYDFGPNYVRSYSVMNPYKTSNEVAQGDGNYYYNIGTGTILYGIAGYVCPSLSKILPGKVQLTGALHYRDLEALPEPSLQYDLGVNYYISGYNSKITLQYSSWNVYSETKITGTKGAIVCQLQMYL